VPLSPETELSRLNRNIKAKHNEILELRGIYRGIGGECEDLKRRLNERARDINGISDCVSKKNYFLQLKKQTAQYVHSDNDEEARMLESKRELAYYLNSIGPQ
jgi:deoxyadenosine/deoxycytidine kinase